VIKKGYAVIIQNMKYKGNELCSPISNVVVSEFFKRCGFENNTETWQDLREQVMFYFCQPTLTTKHS